MRAKRRAASEAAAAFALIGVLFLALFHPVLRAEFDLIDDHQLVRFSTGTQVHPQLPDSLGPPDSLWEIAVQNELDLGRFRPVYYAVRLGELAVLGLNPHAWHALVLLIGVVTCALFYHAARGLSWPPWISFTFVLWLVIQLNSTRIWVTLGPAETIGMLFAAVAVWAVVRAAHHESPGRWDGVALVAASLAALSKEPFALLGPALVLLRLLLQDHFFPGDLRSLVRRMWVLVALWGLAFVLHTGGLALLLRAGGFGASTASLERDSFSPVVWLRRLWFHKARFAYFLPVVLAGIMLAWRAARRQLEPRALIHAALSAVIVAAWVVPQLITYADTFNERYMYPAIVGLAALNAGALLVLHRAKAWIVLGVLAPVLLVLFGRYGQQTYDYAAHFTARTRALDRAFAMTAANSDPDHVIVADVYPRDRSEAAVALVIFLGHKGVSAPIYFNFSGVVADNAARHVDSQFRAIFPAYLDAGALDGARVDTIILLTPAAGFEANPPEWFEAAQFTRHDLTGTVKLPLVGHITAEFTATVYTRR